MKVTITIDMTPEQVAQLLISNPQSHIKPRKKGFKLKGHPTKINWKAEEASLLKKVKTNVDRIVEENSLPPIRIEKLYRYRNTVPSGVGRPFALTPDGCKKVWELHKAGYSLSQIASAFEKIAHRETVRRVIKQVSLHLKEV